MKHHLGPRDAVLVILVTRALLETYFYRITPDALVKMFVMIYFP